MPPVYWNNPPNWPAPPPGWVPPPNWSPPAEWPPPPYGWQFWTSAPARTWSVQAAGGNSYVGVAIGAALLLISGFLPWVNVSLLGSLDLFQLFRVGGAPIGIPWAVVLIALVVGGCAFTKTLSAYIVSAVVGVVSALIGGLFVAGLVGQIQKADGLVSLGIGPLLAVAATVTIAVCGIVGAWKS